MTTTTHRVLPATLRRQPDVISIIGVIGCTAIHFVTSDETQHKPVRARTGRQGAWAAFMALADPQSVLNVHRC